jgi:hypothetical protein
MRKLTNALMMGIAATTTGIIMGSGSAYGANLSFTGNLNDPNDTPSFFFTADGSSTVTIQSSSYAIGGFDPILTLFDAADLFVLEQEDIGAGNLDFQLSQVLPGGNYRAVISAFANFANQPSFADGFTNTGDFFDRTSAYAVDIQGVSPSATSVPEPSSLIGTAVAGFAVVGLKCKLAASRKTNHKSSR